MLLNYDFLEFENDKKVRVIDDKLHVNIFRFFGIGDEDDKIFLGDEISNIADYLLGLSQRLDLLKEPLQRILLMKNRKRL